MSNFPKSGKIKVTPEQSRIVQERLFEEGKRWNRTVLNLSFINKPYLYWDETSFISYGERVDFFEEHPNPEYTMSLFVDEVKEDVWEEVSMDISWALLNQTSIVDHLKTKYTITRK